MAPDSPGGTPGKPARACCERPDNGCPTTVAPLPTGACPARSPRLCARVPPHQSACCLSSSAPQSAVGSATAARARDRDHSHDQRCGAPAVASAGPPGSTSCAAAVPAPLCAVPTSAWPPPGGCRWLPPTRGFPTPSHAHSPACDWADWRDLCGYAPGVAHSFCAPSPSLAGAHFPVFPPRYSPRCTAGFRRAAASAVGAARLLATTPLRSPRPPSPDDARRTAVVGCRPRRGLARRWHCPVRWWSTPSDFARWRRPWPSDCPPPVDPHRRPTAPGRASDTWPVARPKTGFRLLRSKMALAEICHTERTWKRPPVLTETRLVFLSVPQKVVSCLLFPLSFPLGNSVLKLCFGSCLTLQLPYICYTYHMKIRIRYFASL